MTTQSEIAANIENLIPADLLEKYASLTYAEMAEQPDMEVWRAALEAAEKDWFEADDA